MTASPPVNPYCRRTGADQAADQFRQHRRPGRARAGAGGAGENQGLADQRLRDLPEDAHARSPQAGRDGRAAAHAERLARDAPLYSERERAALGWTEAVTRLAQTHAPDEDYQALAAHFTDEEQVKLTLVVSVINAFNHLGVGFRVNPDLLSQLARAAA